MKRRTRLRFISCAALCGTFSFVSTAAFGAAKVESESYYHPVAQASGSPPTVVHTPTGEVTVIPGDTLTAIGARTSRTWEQLAGFNQLPNPNLILADQVLTIPPADYVPPAPAVVIPVAAPAPKPQAAVPPPPPPASSSMPASWQATATCEEGGRNDANYGYFGIKEWNGFDGYARAGDAPLSVQLAWEAHEGISPPDAPGECHSY